MATLQADEDQEPSVETRLVHAVMQRHAVPPRQRHSALEVILGISYQQARRRTSGAVAWTLDELRRVAEHYGESLGSLFGAAPSDGGRSATLLVGPARVPCTLWLGVGPKVAGRTGPLTAIQHVSGEWLVSPLVEFGEGPSFDVRRLVVQMEQHLLRRVAVVDDDVDLADSLAKYLSHSGIDAQAFFSFATLTEALNAVPFDGYVLDWLIGRDDAESVIQRIRTKASCPIVILTGQIESGNVKESRIAAVCSTYRVQNLDKPARPSSILSLLEAGFAAQPITPDS